MVATQEDDDDAFDSISEMYSDEGNDQAGGGEKQISKHGGSSDDDGDVMDYGRISSINTAISSLQQVRTQSMTERDIKKAER